MHKYVSLLISRLATKFIQNDFKKLFIISLLLVNVSLFAQLGVGINTVTPSTALDVNGAITNRETAVAVAGNAATIPTNVNQIQITGVATATATATVTLLHLLRLMRVSDLLSLTIQQVVLVLH